MERILVGLPDFVIDKMISTQSLIFEVSCRREMQCPDCDGKRPRIKAAFKGS